MSSGLNILVVDDSHPVVLKARGSLDVLSQPVAAQTGKEAVVV